MQLQDKVIIITGGSAGIGRAAALRCAAEGAKIVVADINVSGGENTCNEIIASGGQAIFTRTDVTRSAEVCKLLETTINHWGVLDCAFNNAGVEGQFANITRITEQDFDRTIAVDFKGVWLCIKAQVDYFLQNERPGAIVNTASVAGLVGTRGGSAYSSAKHAVVGLTKSAALDVAQRNIRINAVCPGVIETEMVERMVADTGVAKNAFVEQEPIGRLGRSDEIANAVVWLLSDASSFVTGTAVPVDGGYTAR